MKKTIPLLLIVHYLFFSIQIFAQTLPSNLPCGAQTRAWIKQNYYDNQIRTSSISENSGKRYTYAYVDNINNNVTCVYGGYVHPYTPSPTPTTPVQTSAPSGWLTSLTTNGTLMINIEHTVPQSFFNSSAPMVGDIHHLFPTYPTWNSDRSNYRFAEIPDNLTTKWARNTTSQGTKPTTNVDEYSEFGAISGENFYEPREDQKGKTARAVFYFYTVYPTQAGDITTVAALETLKLWHEQHPPTTADIQRNDRIAAAQGNRNFFTDNPNWIYQAWCLSPTLPIDFIAVSASYNKEKNIIKWRVEEDGIENYTLERAENGADKWEIVQNIPPLSIKGISDYTASDDSPFEVSFYRIKATEKNGNVKYSKIVSVAKNANALQLKNITSIENTGFIQLNIETNTDEKANIDIYDMLGRIQTQQTFSLWSGENTLSIPTENMGNGLFILKITQGNKVVSAKFLH